MSDFVYVFNFNSFFNIKQDIEFNWGQSLIIGDRPIFLILRSVPLFSNLGLSLHVPVILTPPFIMFARAVSFF